MVSTEISSPMDRSCNAISFNIPGHITINSLRDSLMCAYGMAHIVRLIMRRWNRIQWHNRPIMLQFQTALLVEPFISKQTITSSTMPFKNKNDCRQNVILENFDRMCFMRPQPYAAGLPSSTVPTVKVR